MRTLLKEKSVPNITMFPMLAKHVERGYIVMFSSATKGMVVHATDHTQNKVGMHLDNWTTVHEKQIWEKLPLGSTVTLEQSND